MRNTRWRDSQRSNFDRYESFACHNRVIELNCLSENQLIVIESAVYGRNNIIIASHCRVPVAPLCHVDVQFPLNRVCGGRQSCALAASIGYFGDPCGFDEFLTVVYRCVTGNKLRLL